MLSFRIGKLWAQNQEISQGAHFSVLERIVIRKKSTVFRFLDNHLILTDAECLVIWLGMEAQLFRLLHGLCVW